MKTIRIAELYLACNLFQDPANQTIGMPIVGPSFDELVENRRLVTGKVTDAGKAVKDHVAALFRKQYGVEVHLKWNKHCGCSSCPCSPGFDVRMNVEDADLWKYRDFTRRGTSELYRLVIWVDTDGTLRVTNPKSKTDLFPTARPLKSWA